MLIGTFWLSKLRHLNDVIGVQCYPSNIESSQEDIMQSWHTRTSSNCNLVEIPQSVLDLLVTGDNRIFNFLEAMNPINLRKEVENCLPVAFQVWAIPKFRKLLDEKISLLVFGGSLLKETDDNETSDQGFIYLLLPEVKIFTSYSVYVSF